MCIKKEGDFVRGIFHWKILAVGFALLFALSGFLYAEQVEHHGQQVEQNGTTTDCIACHDGSIAKNVSVCTVKCGFNDSHSVFKDYPPRGKEGSYVPVNSLQEKGIQLVNGKVACISCHDLKKTGKYRLVIDNEKSRLCFACHIQ